MYYTSVFVSDCCCRLEPSEEEHKQIKISKYFH